MMYIQKIGKYHVDGIDHVMKYLNETKSLFLRFNGDSNTWELWEAKYQCQASWELSIKIKDDKYNLI